MLGRLTFSNETDLLKSLLIRNVKLFAEAVVTGQYPILIILLRAIRKEHALQDLISKVGSMYSILPGERYGTDHDIASHTG